jgi:hypothetical protein
VDRDLGQRVGCIVIGVSLLAVAFVGLLAFYISETGSFPFPFVDGRRGIPPWVPLIVLVAITSYSHASRASGSRRERRSRQDETSASWTAS